MNHWLIPGARTYAGHSGSAMDNPAKTVKAGVHGVPGGENAVVEDDGKVRYFTFRELARLQSFPDKHFFGGARIHVTRQIGNAVPPGLARAVAQPLYQLLANHFAAQVIGGSHGTALARL
jgi:DNA (cytosine-5)-methyltransferase 1